MTACQWLKHAARYITQGPGWYRHGSLWADFSAYMRIAARRAKLAENIRQADMLLARQRCFTFLRVNRDVEAGDIISRDDVLPNG